MNMGSDKPYHYLIGFLQLLYGACRPYILMFHLHDVHHGDSLLEFWRSVSTTHQLKAMGL